MDTKSYSYHRQETCNCLPPFDLVWIFPWFLENGQSQNRKNNTTALSWYLYMPHSPTVCVTCSAVKVVCQALFMTLCLWVSLGTAWTTQAKWFHKQNDDMGWSSVIGKVEHSSLVYMKVFTINICIMDIEIKKIQFSKVIHFLNILLL